MSDTTNHELSGINHAPNTDQQNGTHVTSTATRGLKARPQQICRFYNSKKGTLSLHDRYRGAVSMKSVKSWLLDHVSAVGLTMVVGGVDDD